MLSLAVISGSSLESSKFYLDCLNHKKENKLDSSTFLSASLISLSFPALTSEC